MKRLNTSQEFRRHYAPRLLKVAATSLVAMTQPPRPRVELTPEEQLVCDRATD